MSTVKDSNGNPMVEVERNKERIRLGVEGKRKMFNEAGHAVSAGEGAYVDTWLNRDQVAEVINQLECALDAADDYHNKKWEEVVRKVPPKKRPGFGRTEVVDYHYAYEH
jgi:hypothetical protein